MNAGTTTDRLIKSFSDQGWRVEWKEDQGVLFKKEFERVNVPDRLTPIEALLFGMGIGFALGLLIKSLQNLRN